MIIHVKNMVCNRCKMVVKMTLEKLELHPLDLKLGTIELQENDIFKVKKQLSNEQEKVKIGNYFFKIPS